MSFTNPFNSTTTTQRHHSQTQTDVSLGQISEQKSNVDVNTKEWVREVLRQYLAKYVRDFLSKRRDNVPSPVSSQIAIPLLNSNSAATGEAAASYSGQNNRDDDHFNDEYLAQANGSVSLPFRDSLAERNLKVGLSILELNIMEETALGDDRITYLSRIVSLAIKYSVGGRNDHLIHWLVKMPSKHFDERNLARATNVHCREVNFYTEILQYIKLWLEVNTPSSSDSEDSQSLTLNVPSCYFAYFQDSTELDIGNEPYDHLPHPEYTLVLDDLRTQGFGKRHFSIGLTIDEAAEALREIAKFHATCWSMAQHSSPDLMENWSSLLKWDDLYTLFLGMIVQGFHHLRFFRRNYIREKALADLADALLNLEPKLPVILENLLRPLPPPAVTTLVHMDLWTDNLLFRDDSNAKDGGRGGTIEMDSEKDGKRDSNSPSTTTDSESKTSDGELDCMILDWQMVSLGRVSHDLGILMMTSLDGDVRRDHGHFLIKFYYETFEKIVNSFKLEIPFEFADLIAQYKDSCLLATLLSIGKLELVVSEQSTLQRFFEALEDLRDEQLI